MKLSEKAAYLKGLAEGMKIDENTNEGKLLLAIMDVLGDVALDLEDIDAELDDMAEVVSDLEEGVCDLEDAVYGDEDDATYATYADRLKKALEEDPDNDESLIQHSELPDIYPLSRLSDIKDYCDKMGWDYWEYVEQCEGPEIWEFLDHIWDVMCETVQRGLNNDGVLPGGLKVARKASTYYVKSKSYTDSLSSRAKIYAYALAVAEENASGGTVVTAPTCGSCGVLPGVLYHMTTSREFLRIRVLRALATAGLFGNVVKTNASISGAEVGCQGEIGVACAMAAAAACQLFGGTPAQIEYAAEMGLEHHLGLTCDPVCGLVQVPCIERNAVAAARALDANAYATLSDGSHLVSFDKVVAVMKETGINLPSLYRETSEGGLALHIKR